MSNIIKVNKKYWGIEIDLTKKNLDEKYYVSLGNLNDAGWYWYGNGIIDLLIFIYRITYSKFLNEFKKFIKSNIHLNNIIFNDIKNNYIKYNISDLVYVMSGDNKEWVYGEGMLSHIFEDEIYNIENELKDKKVDDSLIDKIINDMYDKIDLSFNNFYKKTEIDWDDLIDTIIRLNSNDLLDLIDNFNSEDVKVAIQEILYNFLINEVNNVLLIILNKYNIKI